MFSVKFKHQSVCDLVWAISSPPLVSHTTQPCLWPDSQWYKYVYEESLPWLERLDDDPSELENMLAQQKDRRLGKYFETLWFYWFSKHPRYEILENNLQIIIDGETLGEIDFIVLDKTSKQTVHWEVAVKFYLGVDDTSKMSNWHGPNLRDRLDIKVQHLLQRQSVVSKDQRVRQWLTEKGLYIDQCAVILKGRLYYPWHSQKSYVAQDVVRLRLEEVLMARSSPPQCSAEHLRSWWFKENQFDAEFDNNQCFLPLIKQGWMESISTVIGKDCYTKKQIFNTVSDKKWRFPLQVQIQKPSYTGDRVFIVEENWPENKT